MSNSYPRQWRNFAALGADAIFFRIGVLGFLNVNVILPTFAERLGASAIMVGLLITAMNLAWSLPQMFAGNLAARFSRKKPLVLYTTLAGRVVLLALTIMFAATRAQPAWLALLALSLALMLFFGSDGIGASSWLDLLGKSFPPERRGGYISLWQSIGAIGVLSSAALMSYILGPQGPGFPDNYTWLIGLATLSFCISAIGTSMIYEPPPEGIAIRAHIAWRDFGHHLLGIWKSDERLRRIVTARIMFAYGMMAFPFYVLYVSDRLHATDQMLGLFISAQTIGAMIASLILGRIADRFGSQRAIQIGASIVITAPVLAISLAARLPWLDMMVLPAYVWIYICMGISNDLLFLGFSNYVLDIAPEAQRTIYAGTVNTINSVGMMAPALAGWLLALTSYPVLFGVALLFTSGALILALQLESTRARLKAQPGADG